MDVAAFRRYLEIERGALPGTIKIYSAEVSRFDEWLEDRSLDPSEDTVREWVTELGGKASTIQRRLSALKAFFRSVGSPDYTANVGRPKRHAGIPRPVSDFDERIPKLERPHALAAIFIVETGLRVSEACAIRLDGAIPHDLLVTGKGQKDRIVPLTERARAALAALGGQMPCGPRALQRAFHEVGFTPHQLRHTFACDLAASGADLGEIQDLLGHASPATTRVYAKYGMDRLRSAVERKQPRAAVPA